MALSAANQSISGDPGFPRPTLLIELTAFRMLLFLALSDDEFGDESGSKPWSEEWLHVRYASQRQCEHRHSLKSSRVKLGCAGFWPIIFL
jgi:hypothetical protein